MTSVCSGQIYSILPKDGLGVSYFEMSIGQMSVLRVKVEKINRSKWVLILRNFTPGWMLALARHLFYLSNIFM